MLGDTVGAVAVVAVVAAVEVMIGAVSDDSVVKLELVNSLLTKVDVDVGEVDSTTALVATTGADGKVCICWLRASIELIWDNTTAMMTSTMTAII
ncbi:MAG: hypothetical protein ABI397_02180 [Candidatus Saccharimonas sp.]